MQSLFYIDVALDSAVTITEAKFLFNGMSLDSRGVVAAIESAQSLYSVTSELVRLQPCHGT